MQIWSAEIKELEKLYGSLKGLFPELEKELQQLIKFDDANVILLYSRRCLEVIITDLCECELKRPRKTEPLKGIIDKLNKEEKVPSHIITSMDHLNGLSNYGAHPKAFDPEQVKPVLSNLSIIIKWYLKYKNSQTAGKVKTGDEHVDDKIISGEEQAIGRIKSEEEQTIDKLKTEEEKGYSESLFVPKEIIRKPKVSLLLLLSGILVVVAIIAYPKMFRQDRLEKLRSSGERISVAVMPFQNMTNDTTWNVWQEGIQNNLIGSLSNAEELKVRQIESITSLIQSKGLTNYASITPAVASSISQKLDANIFIYGSINQAGSVIRVNAQLIDTKTEEVFKSFQIEGSFKEENIFQVIDSLSVQVKNFLLISKLEQGTRSDYKTFASTNSPEAYRYFIYGMNAYYKRDFPTAVKLYLQAIAIDSNFTFAYINLSYAYFNLRSYEQAKKWCLRIYRKESQMTMQQKIWTNRAYALFFETPYEEIKYVRQLQEIDDQLPLNYYSLGWIYNKLYQYDKAIPEYEKALEIYNKWGSKPVWDANYTGLGLAYHKTGQYKKEKKLYKKAELDFPDDPPLISRQAILALTEGDTITGNDYIKKYGSLRKEGSASESDIATGIAEIFSEAGIPDKAEEYYRQALSLEPENPIMLNYLSSFLIDKDRSINEGLELVDKALTLSPDDYNYLNTKGWGLYKLGKYKEALDLLEKAWNLKPIYNHEIYLHLEAARKAITG
jgi:tetratricopeptide (TPR) repeat protein